MGESLELTLSPTGEPTPPSGVASPQEPAWVGGCVLRPQDRVFGGGRELGGQERASPRVGKMGEWVDRWAPPSSWKTPNDQINQSECKRQTTRGVGMCQAGGVSMPR